MKLSLLSRPAIVALALLAGPGLLALAPPASAGPALTFTDPSGDALDARGSMDIVKVTIETKNFAPKDTPSLVVTYELAAPLDLSTATAISYELATAVPGCGTYLGFTFSPGTALEGGPGGAYSNVSTNCGGEPDSTGDGTYRGIDARAKVEGNKLIQWISIESLTKEIKTIGKIGSIVATTSLAEPGTGIITTASAGAASDSASTKAEFSL